MFMRKYFLRNGKTLTRYKYFPELVALGETFEIPGTGRLFMQFIPPTPTG